MKVRFKKEFTSLNMRIAYSLITDEIEPEYDEVEGKYCLCYNVAGLGFVNAEKLEITCNKHDEPAIDFFIQITNSLNENK